MRSIKNFIQILWSFILDLYQLKQERNVLDFFEILRSSIEHIESI